MLAFYAVVAFIELRNSAVDVVANLGQRLGRLGRRPAPEAVAAVASAAPVVVPDPPLWAVSPTCRPRPPCTSRRWRGCVTAGRSNWSAPTTLPDDALATLAIGLHNLAQGENYTVYRDADGFRLNRS